MKVIVVGAGLFGAIAAALARKAGHSVTVVDCAEPMAASKCSGNLTKPSWLDSLGREKSQQAYEVLRSLYTVQQIECVIRPLLRKRVKLDWVDPKSMLLPPDVAARATNISEGRVTLENGKSLRGKVLVAAGVWCGRLVPTPEIRSLVGSSLRLPGQVREPSIYLYAPYKHAVAYNLDNKTVWCGDGAAILEANWNKYERINLIKQRAADYFGLNVNKAEIRVGARPYLKDYKQGYFAQVQKDTWVSTGGAKNGMVLAAYQAKQFVEAI